MNLGTDLNELYKDAFQQNGSTYYCGVCKKEYKQEKRLLTHIEQRTCYRLSDVFAGTSFESSIYELYKSISAIHNKRIMPLGSLRKKPQYTMLIKFKSFCIENTIFNHFQYAQYLIEKFDKVNDYAALMFGIETSVLYEYRLFLRKHPELIDSEEYFEQYEETFYIDPTFAIQSILKGNLAIGYFEKNIDKERFLDSMNESELIMMEKVLNYKL